MQQYVLEFIDSYKPAPPAPKHTHCATCGGELVREGDIKVGEHMTCTDFTDHDLMPDDDYRDFWEDEHT